MNIRFLGKIGSVHGGSGGQLIGGDVGHDDFIAPRRRTEPAITVPPAGHLDITFTPTCESANVYQVYRSWHGTNVPCTHYVATDGCCEECGEPVVMQLRFRRDEVEQCKLHGAGAYESMAADISQVRELARAAWVRSLPVWQPDETCGDYARRAGILPPKPGRREQWEDSVWLAAAERMAMELP